MTYSLNLATTISQNCENKHLEKSYINCKMLYSCKTNIIHSECKQNLLFHNCLERGEGISPGQFPDFLGTADFIYSLSLGCLWMQSKDTIILSSGNVKQELCWEKSLTFERKRFSSLLNLHCLPMCDIKLCQYSLLEEGIKEAEKEIKIHKNKSKHVTLSLQR